MQLNENHKEFTVKCFAEYMTLREVVDTFIREFKDDLPQPPPPEMPNYEEEVSGVEFQLSREEYIKTKMEEIKHRYYEIYDLDATKEIRRVEKNYIETFKKEFDKVWQMERKQLHQEQLSEYQLILDNHYNPIRKKLSDQLRRLNITHTRFPEKYRKLFNESRIAFFKNKRDENFIETGLTNDDNIRQELELIFGHVKNILFLETDTKEVIKHVDAAHCILKTLSTDNKLVQKDPNTESQNIGETIPNNSQQFKDTPDQ